jgi:hypothetical protein
MFRAIKRFFNGLYIYFTDRPRHNQWKRYMKRQKAFRKELVKQAKEFCPWSGYYMHKMMTTMLEFYNKTYEAGDMCWSTEERVKKIANQTKKALDYANDLDIYEDLEKEELISIAEKEPGFKKYLEKWEKKTGLNTKESPSLLYGVAYDYFEKKYTEGMYNEIGKHIWEWCD